MASNLAKYDAFDLVSAIKQNQGFSSLTVFEKYFLLKMFILPQIIGETLNYESYDHLHLYQLERFLYH